MWSISANENMNLTLEWIGVANNPNLSEALGTAIYSELAVIIYFITARVFRCMFLIASNQKHTPLSSA